MKARSSVAGINLYFRFVYTSSRIFRRINVVSEMIFVAPTKAELWREFEGFCVFIPVCLLERFSQKLQR